MTTNVHPASHPTTQHATTHRPAAPHSAPVARAATTAGAAGFGTLALAEPLQRAIREEGYTTPTPIQQQAIPPAIEGRDLLGCAQTGTGKTAAFALPILHRLMTQPRNMNHRGPALPRALILAPTRELATQIAESFETYGRHTGLRCATIYGGVSQYHQERALRAGVDILIATPGRLIDLMEQRLTNFSQVGIFVLDEADRMLDMGFIQPIRRIVAALPCTPAQRQTLLFSATMPSAIQELAHALLKHPVKISIEPAVKTAARVEQSLIYVPRVKKQALLHHLLIEYKVQRAVVFTKTKHGADRVMKKLVAAGISAQAIHGNKAQNQRTRALDAFRGGRSRILVATDVAARGLDVDGITHVFNFDLPMEPEAYVHRIGRTGRAGAAGKALSFCDPEERGLLRDIERLTGNRLPTQAMPDSLPEVPHTPSASHERVDAGQRGHRRDGGRPGWTSAHPARKPAHRASDGHGHNGYGSARAPQSSEPPAAARSMHGRVPASVLREGQGTGHGSAHGQGHARSHGHGSSNAGGHHRGPRSWSKPHKGR